MNSRYATHEPHGGGRLKETAYTGPPIPTIPKYKLAAVEDWLYARRNLNRPIPFTPWLFAIICELHARQQYLPVRRRLAEHMKCSEHTIDKAIAVGLARNELEVRWGHQPGEGNTGATLKRYRFVIPEPSLLLAYTSATHRLSTPDPVDKLLRK